MAGGTQLAPYEPEFAPHTNGSRLHRRRRVFRGLSFGFLIGALLATSLVPRLQWLNLAAVGWWGRPVIAAFAAGLMVGWFQHHIREAVTAGGLAGLLGLWVVYGIVRISVHVIFIERSIARVILADLARLAAYAVPAGTAGAVAVVGLRLLVSGRRRSRTSGR